ncbi:MAG: TetR/AcrR family transcriptional regulator [Actinomycetaceae bacterium]
MDQPHAPTSARAIATAEVRRRIVEESRRQLGVVGPAQLSLRAVARELGMASSAIYRHFASRDELVTTLIVAAYEELADATDAAVAAAGGQGVDRWRAWCTAVRGWALAHPHDYALIYGSPIPGYAAPRTTTASAFRVLRPIIEMFAAIESPPGAVDPGERAAAFAPLSGLFRELTGAAPREGVGALEAARGINAWANVMGFVSLELFGHLENGIADPNLAFAQTVEQTAADLGIRPVETTPGAPPAAGAAGTPPAADAAVEEGSLW